MIGAGASLARVAAGTVALAAFTALGDDQPTAAWRTVTRVIDGDTIELDDREEVRLIGVDASELNDPRAIQRHHAERATAFTKQLLHGNVVRLEFDWPRKDKYRRTLAYVFLLDGTFANAEIIRQGYGFALTRFPFTYLEEFRALERDARERGAGLWATSGESLPVVPGVSRQARPQSAANVPERVPTHAVDEGTCPSSSPIKGNRTTRSGACIYHLPGGRFYAAARAEQCFPTEAAAVAAGCRRSRR